MPDKKCIRNCFAATVMAFALCRSEAQSIPGCKDKGVTPSPITVQNGSLYRNNEHFILRGLQVRGFVAALQVSQDNASYTVNNPASPDASPSWQVDATAQQAYGNAELNAMGTWQANLVRIQVSQPSLDPQNAEVDLQGKPLYSASYNYLQTVITAVNLARCAGFAVIISMQDEKNSGEPNHMALSTAATRRAWQGLESSFGTAGDVMFEIYNEPSLSDTSMNWITWAHAGEASYNSNYGNPNGYLGMQSMITDMRADGAMNNVLIMDGLAVAATLDGIPGLNNPPMDATGNAVYAVHPYLRGGTPAQYSAQFESVQPLTYPVIGTEWSADAYNNPSGGIGLEGQPYDDAVQALNNFTQNNLHFVAGAFDVPGIMTQNVTNWTPTNYNNYASEMSNPSSLDNAGLLVQKLFQNKYGVTLTDADGVTH